MKLYAINLIDYPRTATDQFTGVETPVADPQGWHEFCEGQYGRPRDFFLPNTRRVYRSRSSAVERVRMVQRWGGEAELLLSDAEFLPESEVKKAREDLKKLERAEALRAEAAALEAEVTE